ncbi:hypothetical protein NDU88_004837 [Pleurodeles waltl]|uniref:Uncharacterized protein n=1 Tax=Pleurodeles waltl TaxID=8319 RepID=A0AAV7VJC9_PLEWA|nr:hypothetical protein NDU88_004837 [Pleurodeles waltl]
MEHAAVWLKEMEEVPKETEPGIITEIRKKDDPRVKVEWNKPTKNSETIKANTEEKRKAQEWRILINLDRLASALSLDITVQPILHLGPHSFPWDRDLSPGPAAKKKRAVTHRENPLSREPQCPEQP